MFIEFSMITYVVEFIVMIIMIEIERGVCLVCEIY